MCILYMLLLSIPITFGGVYSFDLGEIGISYVAQIVASVIGIAMTFYTEKLYGDDIQRKGSEARLWSGMAGGILLPLGC